MDDNDIDLAGWIDVPRKGNVDRNVEVAGTVVGKHRTFPARGTWIEMLSSLGGYAYQPTFPARGTWIEI